MLGDGDTSPASLRMFVRGAVQALGFRLPGLSCRSLSEGPRLNFFYTTRPTEANTLTRDLPKVLLDRQESLKKLLLRQSCPPQPSPWKDEIRRARTQHSYPIDNEKAKLNDEQAGFEDHIFLERHMKDWVPQDGPVRVFMELVVHGLRKNPHLTAARKQEYMQKMKEHFMKFGDDPALFPSPELPDK